MPNTAVVSVIDLELDDGIHVGTQGLMRAGRVLKQVRVASASCSDVSGATTPTLDRVMQGANNTLVLKFKGVNMSSHLVQGGGGRGFGQGMGSSGMMRMMPLVPGAVSPGIHRPPTKPEPQHRRLLDPQAGRNQHPAHLRGRRRQGKRHRHPGSYPGPPGARTPGTATGWPPIAT